jgi:tRNA-uridine 2-sulfurtransferase
MRLAVAMSGGVDSSTTALLCREEGHEVVGFTMRVWGEDRSAGLPRADNLCSGASHLRDAAAVAALLGIEHYVVDLRERFAEVVMTNFRTEYLRGRTPIPCVHCNRFLKFGGLWAEARRHGCEALATGHYVRREVAAEGGGWRLCRGREVQRDQSYFLFFLGQDDLEVLRFPLGDRRKEDVRRLAAEHGLPVYAKPDSQDICFVSDGDYREVLTSCAGDDATGGEIVDTTGRVLGRHQGCHRYTIGQRRGLGIAAPEPLYVVRLEPAARRVVVGSDEELYSAGVLVGAVSWVSGVAPAFPVKALVKLRSLHPGAEAVIEGGREGLLHCRFATPQRAVTPGQAAVFHQGETVLGGGWIERGL